MLDQSPQDLLEYSVVFTDRSVNHMSAQFQACMNSLHAGLTDTYKAESMVLVPGGGSYAMEAVARQFGLGKRKTFLRNGWFSYRWTQIFDAIEPGHRAPVLKAQRTGVGETAPFAPMALEEVVKHIAATKPQVFFAPHVETSAGMVLPDDYIREVGAAVRANDGLFVLDCVASGAVWIDMQALNVDVMVTAPQKGWSSSPSAGVVLMGARALDRMDEIRASSFTVDLGKWHQIMQAYLNGGHAYHATMPTDALLKFRDTMKETEAYGFDKVKQEQLELGQKARALLTSKGFKSVAAEGFQAPGVVVSYTDDSDIHNGKKFMAEGLQIAAGVPLQCDEPEGFQTFRIGLFGLDKLHNVDRTVSHLNDALEKILS